MRSGRWASWAWAAIIAVLVGVALVMPACRTRQLEGDKVAIYAAAVRHVLAEHREDWAVIFVQPRLVATARPQEPAPDGGPVPAGLVEALQGLAPRVELASAEEAIDRSMDQPGWGNVVREDGILITLGAIRPQPDGSVLLAVQYHVDAVHGGGYEYRLRGESGGWRVVEATLRWLA